MLSPDNRVPTVPITQDVLLERLDVLKRHADRTKVQILRSLYPAIVETEADMMYAEQSGDTETARYANYWRNILIQKPRKNMGRPRTEEDHEWQDNTRLYVSMLSARVARAVVRRSLRVVNEADTHLVGKIAFGFAGSMETARGVGKIVKQLEAQYGMDYPYDHAEVVENVRNHIIDLIRQKH